MKVDRPEDLLAPAAHLLAHPVEDGRPDEVAPLVAGHHHAPPVQEQLGPLARPPLAIQSVTKRLCSAETTGPRSVLGS